MMTSFDARLRLVGQSGFPLGVVVDLTDERMTITAGQNQVADWSLDDIDVISEPDGFHVRAEGEELVLNVADSARFAVELGAIDFLRRTR